MTSPKNPAEALRQVRAHGAGLPVTADGKRARLVKEEGRLVIAGATSVTDEAIHALIETGRK
jgi:hypothetical protein